MTASLVLIWCASLLLSETFVVLLHECGHARAAEKLTAPDEPVVIYAGLPVVAMLSPTWVTRRLGLQRTAVVVGPVPLFGYCAHGDLSDRSDFETLYEAGVLETKRLLDRAAPWAGGAVLLCVAALLLFPDLRMVWSSLIAAVLGPLFALLFNAYGNRAPVGPKVTGNEGTDGYVLRRLKRDSSYVPVPKHTVDDLVARFGKRRGCQGLAPYVTSVRASSSRDEARSPSPLSH